MHGPRLSSASLRAAQHPGHVPPAFAGDDSPESVSSALLRRYHCPMTSQPIRHPLRILGIDPGLRRTGWGVIEIDGNRLAFVGCGSVETPDGLPLAERLFAASDGLAGGPRAFKA